MNSKFHERFEIEVGTEEAKNRFVYRAYNFIFNGFIEKHIPGYQGLELKREIVSALGKQYFDLSYEYFIEDDFYKCLQAIEVSYDSILKEAADRRRQSISFLRARELERVVISILGDSEVDLGIKWENGKFVKTGAKLLDDELVNRPLRWLHSQRYQRVLIPYSKALQNFLHRNQSPDLFYDVIRDMYEALEALAKIITGRDNKDLSSNAELLISKMPVSKDYKKILKEYIAYANQFRHALKEGQTRPTLSISEVESFIYLTGIFIRLSITSETGRSK